MNESQRESLTDSEFIRELDVIWGKIKAGVYSDKTSVEAELHPLMEQAGISPDSEWGYWETHANDLLISIKDILPYVHLGVPIVDTRRKITQLINCIHWGPKQVQAMIAEIKGDMELKNWSTKDLGLNDDWFAMAVRESVLLIAKGQLAGLNASTHEKSKVKGMRDLENFLRKHGLTIQDLEEKKSVNS